MWIVREDNGAVIVEDLQTIKAIGCSTLDHPADDFKSWTDDSPPIRRLVSCLLTVAFVKDSWSIKCLILLPTGLGGNKYYRIGMMTLTDEDWFGNLEKGWYYKDPDETCPLPLQFQNCTTTVSLV